MREMWECGTGHGGVVRGRMREVGSWREVLIDLIFRPLYQRYDYFCPDEEKAYAPDATSTALPLHGRVPHEAGG